jgi:hypothetical protein
MKRLLIVATIVAVFGVLLTAATGSAQQERDEVMVVVPMQYMSAATAAQLFGGQIISASPMYGQSSFGNRGSARGGYGGGYDSGSYRSGPSIGGFGQSNYGQSGYGQGGSYLR